MAHEEEHPVTNGAPGYEVEDAGVREIVYTGIGLAVGTILICLAVLGLFRAMSAMNNNPQPTIEVPNLQALPAGPRLQERPWEELQVLRQREDGMLGTYGWVNKDAGTVRIPVSGAMEALVNRGLPVRQQPSMGGSSVPKNGTAQPANVPRQAVGFPQRKGGAGNAPRP